MEDVRTSSKHDDFQDVVVLMCLLAVICVIQESGAGKKKVLAVFYINMAEYGSIRIESE